MVSTDPPRGPLRIDGLRTVDVNPPIDEAPPCLEVIEVVAKLKGGKAAGIYNISMELLKTGSETMARGLHAVLAAAWQSDTLPSELEKGDWSSLSRKRNGSVRTAATTVGLHGSACQARSLHICCSCGSPPPGRVAET